MRLAEPMHAVDWMPTLADVTGYTAPADARWDGVSQWPLLKGAKVKRAPRSIYIAHGSGDASLRHGGWKLIVRKKGGSELFNITEDPFEKTDLAKDQPEKVAELRALLLQEVAKDNRVLPPDLVGLPK